MKFVGAGGAGMVRKRTVPSAGSGWRAETESGGEMGRSTFQKG